MLWERRTPSGLESGCRSRASSHQCANRPLNCSSQHRYDNIVESQGEFGLDTKFIGNVVLQYRTNFQDKYMKRFIQMYHPQQCRSSLLLRLDLMREMYLLQQPKTTTRVKRFNLSNAAGKGKCPSNEESGRRPKSFATEFLQFLKDTYMLFRLRWRHGWFEGYQIHAVQFYSSTSPSRLRRSYLNGQRKLQMRLH